MSFLSASHLRRHFLDALSTCAELVEKLMLLVGANLHASVLDAQPARDWRSGPLDDLKIDTTKGGIH